MISVKNIYHDYEGKGNFAVSDVSFSIEKGRIFGFLGPSGAGKSTVQNIMTGLLSLQRGEVLYDGQPIQSLKTKFFNQIGVSFEQPNVYAKLTGLENLKYFAALFPFRRGIRWNFWIASVFARPRTRKRTITRRACAND